MLHATPTLFYSVTVTFPYRESVVVLDDITRQYYEASFIFLLIVATRSPSTIIYNRVSYSSNACSFLQFNLTHFFTDKLLPSAVIFILSVRVLVLKVNNLLKLIQKVRSQNAICYRARCYNTKALKITATYLKRKQILSFNFLGAVAASRNQSGARDMNLENIFIASC